MLGLRRFLSLTALLAGAIAATASEAPKAVGETKGAKVNPTISIVAQSTFSAGSYTAYDVADGVMLIEIKDRVTGKTTAFPVKVAPTSTPPSRGKNAGARFEQLIEYADGSGVWAAYNGNQLLGFLTRSADGNWSFFPVQGGSANAP